MNTQFVDLYGCNKTNYRNLQAKYVYKQNNQYTKNDYQKGGSQSNLIIHIGGPSGAGKTTIGKKIKDYYGDKIIMIDIDDLRWEYQVKRYGDGKIRGEFDKIGYQEYIDNSISKQDKNKPLIFVGLNTMPWFHRGLYYDMHATYKFYINIDIDKLFKQKCKRTIERLFHDDIYEEFKNDNYKTMKTINKELNIGCSYNDVSRTKKIWDHEYKDQGYRVLSSDIIFEEIVKIIG